MRVSIILLAEELYKFKFSCFFALYICFELHLQIDFLSHGSVKDVVVPQTVLQEVRHRSLPVFKRLRDVIDDASKRFYVFNNEHHRLAYLQVDAHINGGSVNSL